MNHEIIDQRARRRGTGRRITALLALFALLGTALVAGIAGPASARTRVPAPGSGSALMPAVSLGAGAKPVVAAAGAVSCGLPSETTYWDEAPGGQYAEGAVYRYNPDTVIVCIADLAHSKVYGFGSVTVNANGWYHLESCDFVGPSFGVLAYVDDGTGRILDYVDPAGGGCWFADKHYPIWAVGGEWGSYVAYTDIYQVL